LPPTVVDVSATEYPASENVSKVAVAGAVSSTWIASVSGVSVVELPATSVTIAPKSISASSAKSPAASNVTAVLDISTLPFKSALRIV